MRIKSVVFLMLGGAIVATALFAEAIGLDNDPGWGRGRIAILGSGILIIAFGLFYFFYTDTVLSIFHKIEFRFSKSIIALFVFLQRDWYIFPILILVFLVYVWFASSASWTTIRYLADFMPALTMLSILGFWHGYQLLAQRPRPRGGI